MDNQNRNIPVKPCYSHVGGRLGTLLMEQFIKKGWIKKEKENDRFYYMTPKGRTAFKEMGVDLSQIPLESLE